MSSTTPAPPLPDGPRRADRRAARTSQTSTPRHARSLRSHRVARGLGLTLAACLSFTGVGVATALIKLQGNIDEQDISHLIGDVPTAAPVDPSDPDAGLARTFVFIASDDRSGENEAIGGAVEGMRSDATVLLHLSAQRDRIDLVSIPRDSYVSIPSCTMTDGSTTRPSTQRFNAAFSTGWNNGGDVASAAGCTVKTIQQLTNVPIDGYVIVDFAGFQRMIDALGGVSMCIPHYMNSPDSGLDVQPGRQVFDGATALSFARARTGTGLGDGSDTNRVGRQQELLAATFNEVTGKNLLTDATALYRFFDAATQTLTASPNLASLTGLVGLGFSVRDVPPEKITFMTVPYGPNPRNKNEIVWTDEADDVWAALAEDRPIAPDTPEPSEVPPSTDTTEDPTSPAQTQEPTPTPTKKPGKEPFTPADLPAECG